MKRTLQTLACRAALGWSLCSSLALAGKLDDASERTHKKSPSSPSSEGTSSTGSSTSSDDDTELTPELAALVVYLLLSPITVPIDLQKHVGKERPQIARRYFHLEPNSTDPPTAPASCGAYCQAPTRLSSRKQFELKLGIEAGLDTALFPFFGAELRALTDIGLGLDTRVALFLEPDNGVTDQLLLGKSHLLYRFATFRHAQFFGGVGARYLAGPQGGGAGVDFLYGVDVQFKKIFTADLEFGLGNAQRAFVGQIRGTFGAWLGPAQMYVGWDQTWIDGIPLGGPITGLRLRF